MKKIYILLIVLALFSCNDRRAKRVLTDFIGTEVLMPDSLKVLFNGNDSTLTSPAFGKASLVVIYDSVQCGSCVINRMDEWREIIDFSRGTREKFKVIFLFAPKQGKTSEIRISLMSNPIDYPVFVDEKGAVFTKNSNIPESSTFHTFLLNDQNKVVIVGSPIKNNNLWKLYKDEIMKLIE